MNDTTVKISASIDAGLFRDFAVFDTFRVKKRWKAPALFALILLLSALLCFSRYERADQAVMLGVVLLAVGLGLPVVYFINFFHSIKTQIGKLGLEQPRQVYTLTLNDSILVESPNGETARYQWDSVFGVYRRKGCTYLYVHASRAFLLPDKDVGEQAQALRDLLARHLPAAAKGGGAIPHQ